jgi:hypothetical protein
LRAARRSALSGIVIFVTADGEVPAPFDLDMAAASLQADAADLHTFFEVLATKLTSALGSALEVERESGFFNKNKGRLKSLTVRIGDNTFQATTTKGRIECRKLHAVRGIVLNSEELGLPDWLKQLLTALNAEAQNSAAARNALENLLT